MTDVSAIIETATPGPVPTTVRLPIGGGPLGALLVGPRRDGRLHDPRSIALLEDTARLAATAVRMASQVDRPV